MSIGPAKVISAKMYNKTTLTCEAEGNPPPRYKWLQMLPTQEVLIRGYDNHLVIDNVTYEHQGEFVCTAENEINDETRTYQSEPIKVEVTGAPQVLRYAAKRHVVVGIGAEAVLEVEFCANPVSNQSWHLGDMGLGTGNNIILAAGTGHGRFVAETARPVSDGKRDHCYISTLKIQGAHPSDSHNYELRLSNAHGVDKHLIQLAVRGKGSFFFFCFGAVFFLCV